MEKQTNLVDVSRLYTIRAYSETFGVPYNTVYSRCNMIKSKNKIEITNINGAELIYVTEEQEKELLKNKKKGGK